jgi:formylglycine-generating enzyme required for sulfatase activity
MGSEDYDDERPPHVVHLDAFWLDAHEVTVSEFRRFRQNYQPGKYASCEGCPATDVSWEDAAAYCESVEKRLPTEAEWEKACRGPEGHAYSWGAEPDAAKGRFGVAVADGPAQVESQVPNGYGLYDMSGNVWEWVQDHYGEGYYSESPARNPQGPSSGLSRVMRGGSWHLDAAGVRCSGRNHYLPNYRNYDYGFRCAK